MMSFSYGYCLGTLNSDSDTMLGVGLIGVIAGICYGVYKIISYLLKMTRKYCKKIYIFFKYYLKDSNAN